MIDRAAILMEQGASIACHRVEGMNDNMSHSHYHTYFELYFLEGGERHHVMQDQQYETKIGSFMIFAPYIMHYSFSDHDVSFKRTVLYFKDEAVASPVLLDLLKNGSGLYEPEQKISSSIHFLLKELQKEQEQERDDPLHETVMENLLNTLLLTIMRSTQVSPKPETQSRIAKVISYIEKNYQHELRLQDIAAEFYVSEYYLCHEFKKYTNRTIVQYTNALRILHAQRLITESDLNFTKIAEQTGFSSLTHFNRTFKSVVGTSPSAYRKANPKHE